MRKTQSREPEGNGLELLLRPRDPRRLHLNSRRAAAMAHPEVAAHAQLSQARLGRLHLLEPRRRDLESVLHAARETRRGRGIPRRQAELAGHLADCGLGEPHFCQRRAHSRLLRD